MVLNLQNIGNPGRINQWQRKVSNLRKINVIFLKKKIFISYFLNVNIALDFVFNFPGSSNGKESACSVGDPGSIPGSERSPALEKEMITHSSILAWRIPWTEEPGRLQFRG